jgi:hypothetical protein
VRQELRRQVKTHLGQGDGVLVCEPSGFPKSGGESVDVTRQWCGRLGKVDNCQVAIYLGYVSRKGHTRVDTRLSLPKKGPRPRPVSTKLALQKSPEATARVTSWPWRCWQKMVPVCRIAGLLGPTRWGAPLGCVVG